MNTWIWGWWWWEEKETQRSERGGRGGPPVTQNWVGGVWTRSFSRTVTFSWGLFHSEHGLKSGWIIWGDRKHTYWCPGTKVRDSGKAHWTLQPKANTFRLLSVVACSERFSIISNCVSTITSLWILLWPCTHLRVFLSYFCDTLFKLRIFLVCSHMLTLVQFRQV